MGLNTVETYVAWNAHAPCKGEFRLTVELDLGRFLDLIAGEEMHAIVRPGPYICAEWDNGGLPACLGCSRAAQPTSAATNRHTWLRVSASLRHLAPASADRTAKVLRVLGRMV